MVTKNKKKRLIDLEVDEVSLVDKPAIGETVYLTKRVEDGTVKTKDGKKKEPVKKDEGGAGADPAATGGAEADALKARPDQMEKDVGGVRKALTDVETMLQQSLQLHEMVTVHLNEMLSLNLGALDAVMMMMEDSVEEGTEAEDAEEGATENQTMSLITGIRESVKAVQTEVSKAGAKMSRTRLQALRDIAAKLTELITQVEPAQADDAGAGTGGKKKAVLVSVTKRVKASLETATAEIGECMNAVGELKKGQATLEERLKGLEGTAGASDAIGDEDDDTTEGGERGQQSQKSVFSGLIPTDQIRESVRKRQVLAGGATKK